MKVTTLLALAFFTAGCATYSTSVSAGGTSFIGYAKVVNVEEVYRNVRTSRHQDCYYDNTNTYHRGDHNIGNELLGAIIGGVIGNQLGNHNVGATVGGAVLGGVVANSMEGGHNHNGQTRRCTNHYHSEPSNQISHYRVTYEYGGETFTIRQSYKPNFNHQKIVVTITIKRH